LGLLLNVYQVYYSLAGVAGLVLYFSVARICWARIQDWSVHPVSPRGLLTGALVILACTAEVEFCFSRAALLIRLAT